MQERLRGLSHEERAARSRTIIRHIVGSPEWRAATQVLLFAPLPAEPDLDLLWQGGALIGRQAIYPRVDGTMVRLYRVQTLDELSRSRWGLREPSPLAEHESMLDDVSLALVPGLAFDAAGGRLGRGGGYYDRLLARRDPTKTRLVGVGFAFQRVAEPLPLAAHDVKMDEVCND